MERRCFVHLTFDGDTAANQGHEEQNASRYGNVEQVLFALVLLEGRDVLLVRLVCTQLLEAGCIFCIQTSFLELAVPNRLDARLLLTRSLLGHAPGLFGRSHPSLFFVASLSLGIEACVDHRLLLPFALGFFLLNSVLLKVHELLE
ncbi:MAG: hypothetical protein ABI461_16605 [Polyangiaceae bacterium]